MPSRDGYAEGIPSWVDLATKDVDAAKSFYETLFGWEYLDPQTEEIPYWMATRNGRLAAGIGPATDDQPFSIWSTHFAVDDADATAEKVKEAGGTVMFGPDDIMDSGRFAFCADPTGAMFGIWEANQHTGAGVVNEHGALNWNELTSDDLDKALPFYTEVFGHETETTEGANGPYTTLSVDGRMVAGAMKPPVPGIPNHWGLYFAVDDLDAAIATAEANGGTLNYGPMDLPGIGRVVGIKDPTGAAFTAIELATEVD